MRCSQGMCALYIFIFYWHQKHLQLVSMCVCGGGGGGFLGPPPNNFEKDNVPAF